MSQIMDWHDQQQPPFGPGQKEKEFPDAFALASALAHAKAKSTRIAVVSKDNDFTKFCAPHPELPHFQDLDALTEAFIAEMNNQVAAIKTALAAHPGALVAHVRDAFRDLTFYPEEDIDGEVQDIEVRSVELDKVRVIAIEDEHCTIAFHADVDFSAYCGIRRPRQHDNRLLGRLPYAAAHSGRYRRRNRHRFRFHNP